ncbi:MAG: NAD(P)/FAD-dependent oxidoreductase [Gammaproteobacteria bacterium]|nr:MAG: NAD(P)/FAD-dependent oxidoreductase [Gammaproteobacteria bacterium]
MNENEKFDLVVIGAGTGGGGVLYPCAKAGWKVAIVDSLPYGGTCALRGCEPKKMLVAVTEGIDWSDRMSGNGLQSDNMSIDWAKMIAFKRTFTDGIPKRLEHGFEKLGVVSLHDTARFIAPGVVQVGDRELHAKYFHIATGARPMTLDILGEELLTTSTEFLELESTPSRVVFVGGGYIAFEFAHIARRAGASEVTILQRGKHPLVQFDPDLVDLLVERSQELGIDIHRESSVDKIVKDGDDLHVEFATPQGRGTIVCDLVVHGAGRVPNIDTLDLDEAGVEVGSRGIQVNEFMRSVSNPAVFAVGDCADTGAPNLTPVSAIEARIAAKNLLAGKDTRRMEYPPIPSVVFTLPALARVGLLEEEARQQGIEFDVNFQKTGGRYSSMRVGERYSAHKVLVEKGTGRIVGAHLMGPGAEEQINLFSIAMGAGLSGNQLKAVIFAFPSYGSDLKSMV